MAEVLTQLAPPPQPLVALTDDEVLFRENVRQFADQSIRPKVKEMDEKGVFDQQIINEFFRLGLMGIEIPEQYGGAGRSEERRVGKEWRAGWVTEDHREG